MDEAAGEDPVSSRTRAALRFERASQAWDDVVEEDYSLDDVKVPLVKKVDDVLRQLAEEILMRPHFNLGEVCCTTCGDEEGRKASFEKAREEGPPVCYFYYTNQTVARNWRVHAAGISHRVDVHYDTLLDSVWRDQRIEWTERNLVGPVKRLARKSGLSVVVSPYEFTMTFRARN